MFRTAHFSYSGGKLERAYATRARFLLKKCRTKATGWQSTSLGVGVLMQIQAEMSASQMLNIALEDAPSSIQLIKCNNCGTSEEKLNSFLKFDRTAAQDNIFNLKSAILTGIATEPQCSKCEMTKSIVTTLQPLMFVEVSELHT